MPNQPKTKNRVVRVPDELWDAAQRAAGARGEVLSEVIRERLRAYVDETEMAAEWRETGARKPDADELRRILRRT